MRVPYLTLTSIPSDSDSPFILTPSILLTQKTDTASEAVCDTDAKDLLRVQWRRVQHLAKMFWERWKKEYLHTLQARKKWHQDQRNVSVGDVVLLKNVETHRNQWPLGRVIKVEVHVRKDDKMISYIRPVTNLVILLDE